MPWKLILALLIAVIVAVFIGFNLGNYCDISFGFATAPSVPVYLTAMIAFLSGMLATLPFVVTAGRKRMKAMKAGASGAGKGAGAEAALENQGQGPGGVADSGAGAAGVKSAFGFFGRKKGK
jgi:uncharacterized integral membrane protein